MKAPVDLPAADRPLWDRLFVNLKAINPVVVEMAKRYVVWFKLFETSAALVASEGAEVEFNGGKTKGKNVHFVAMSKAEDQMRKLWDTLSKYMTEPTADDGLGQFKGL